jgi:hypothetical protein
MSMSLFSSVGITSAFQFEGPGFESARQQIVSSTELACMSAIVYIQSQLRYKVLWTQ